MVWAKWTESLAAALTCAGLALGQETAAPVPEMPAGGQVVTIQEVGSAPQDCRVQKIWRQPDGNMAYEVQALDTGERMTIVESDAGPTTAQGGVQGKLTRIFRWGRRMTAPAGIPEPDADTVVVSPSAEAVAEAPADEAAPTDSVSVEPPTAPPAPIAAAKHAERGPSPVIVQPRAQPALMPAVAAADVKPATPAVMQACTPAPVAVGPAPAPSPAAWSVPVPAAEHADMGRTPLIVQSPAQPPPLLAVRPAEVPPAAGPVVVQIYSPPPVAPAPTPNPVSTPARSAAFTGAAVKPAPISDWRESWGKADDHQSDVPRVQLPRADNTKPDPLLDLPHFVPLPTENRLADRPDASLVKLKSKAPEPAALAAESAPLDPPPCVQPPAVIKAPAVAPTPVVVNGPAAPPTTGVEAGAAAWAPAVVATPGPAAAGDSAGGPGGMGVYRPLQMPPGARAVTLPKDEPPGNAFADIEPAKQAGAKAAVTLATNAFSGQPRPPEAASAYGPRGMNPAMMQFAAQGGAYPASPYGRMYAGGAGMVLAGGYYGPMVPTGLPSQYAVWHTNAPAPPAAAERPRPAMLPESATPTSADDLLAALHDALLPSEREAAAESLADPDKATDPRVVTAVAKAAREDPARCVRATCVRCLVKMQADSDVVKTTLQALQGDAEAEVRQEAEQALAHLADPAPAGGPVQAVGHFTSDGSK
jgi:hypothetical protein